MQAWSFILLSFSVSLCQPFSLYSLLDRSPLILPMACFLHLQLTACLISAVFNIAKYCVFTSSKDFISY